MKIPSLSYNTWSLKSLKGSHFGRSLPILAIIGSSPRLYPLLATLTGKRRFLPASCIPVTAREFCVFFIRYIGKSLQNCCKSSLRDDLSVSSPVKIHVLSMRLVSLITTWWNKELQSVHESYEISHKCKTRGSARTCVDLDQWLLSEKDRKCILVAGLEVPWAWRERANNWNSRFGSNFSV